MVEKKKLNHSFEAVQLSVDVGKIGYLKSRILNSFQQFFSKKKLRRCCTPFLDYCDPWIQDYSMDYWYDWSTPCIRPIHIYG